MVYLILLVILFPFVAAGAISFLYSHSWLSPLLVILGTIAGAITILVSGITWLQSIHSEWLQSQAVGFILPVVIVPFYAYLGAIAGASLVAILYRYNNDHNLSIWFIVAAAGVTIVLTGLIPAAIGTMQTIKVNDSGLSTTNAWFWIALPIVMTVMGTTSAWLSSAFTFWMFSVCRLMR